MKNIAVLLFSLGILSACAVTPIPQDIKDRVAMIPAEELPRNPQLERSHCPIPHHSFNKREECREAVRRNLAAWKMMREQNNTPKQENIEEQSDETIKN